MSGRRAKLERRVQKPHAAPNWSALDVRMLRDDVDWLASLGQATQSDTRWQGVTGLALTPHMARVVHEGLALVGSLRPAQVRAIELEFSLEIAAARHTVKLIDDNKKLYAGVIQDFERIDKEHSNVWALGEDFAIGFRDDRLFTTSRAAAFQRSGVLTDPSTAGNDGYSNRLGYDIGQAAAAILRQFGHAPQQVLLPVDLWGKAPLITTIDRSTYYAKRFEPEFPSALKDILTVIEGAINSALYIFKPIEGPFVGPVFRVLFVTLAHSLRALDEVRIKYPGLAGRRGMSSVVDVIDSPEAVRLRSLRGLRNRCMHYGIPPKLLNLDQNLPMYGLVEATAPGLTFETINGEMLLVLAALSETFSEWVDVRG